MIRFGSSVTNIFTFWEGVGLTSLCYRELRFHFGSPSFLFIGFSPWEEEWQIVKFGA